MQDIARLTYENHELFEIMDMLDRRLNDKGKNWRHVMKALTVLDYIIHTGSENVVLWAKDNLYIIKTLREFQYFDDDGRDQGAAIRSKAKELTSLIQDDERLREERMNRSSARRRRRRGSKSRHDDSPPERGSPSRRSPVGDDDMSRALEESRLMAEEEQRRRTVVGSDEDLRRALALSEEEEKYRLQQSKNNNILFDNSFGQPQQQASLIDTSDFQPPQQQQQFFPVAQQQQQPFVTGQYDAFGNPLYGVQQPLSTGMLQNAYSTGGVFPQYNSNGMFAPQNAFQQQGYEEPQPEPLQPLKTGSNNPFAQPNQNSTASHNAQQPSLSQLQSQQYQQLQQQQQALGPQRTTNFDADHMNELNTLLSTGEGIDTFGNVGELRIPAQHTKSTYINSAGMGIQPTGTGNNNNPFIGTQYTGIATTNRIQPAYTGYGFGNATQSQQQYQNGTTRTNQSNLIDF
jgi:epsin